ncbi:acyl-CoA dehydrogenase family protein [Erwinia sp. DT-104]|uniref:acyl-CoA dehydrogenase family protein n=1 Tax=Erwinia sp. DT-104 TaxID=3396161 RepID=UPI003F1E056A
MNQTGQQIKERMHSHQATLRTLADEAETAGQMPAEAIAVANRCGIWQHLCPQPVGGNCTDAAELIDLWKACAALDGSFGWLSIAYVLATTHCALYLQPSAWQQVFADGAFPLIAGQYQPNGRGRVTEGGYTLTGKWAFGSGIHHADWAVAGFIQVDNSEVVKDLDGRPEIMIAVIPRQSLTLSGHWDTTGLRGTGSINYSCENLFIPAAFCYRFEDPESLRGGALHRIGITEISAVSHGSWALGMAQRAIDEMLLLARKTLRANESQPLARKETFLLDLARSAARLQAAQAFLTSATTKAQREVEQTAGILRQTQNEIRLAATFANEICAEIAEIAYRQMGTAAIARRNPLERVLRDIQTGRQHMMIGSQSYINVARTWFEVDNASKRHR